MADTHFSKLTGRVRILTDNPTVAVTGDEYFNTSTSCWVRYNGTAWIGIVFTSTSSSTSCTTSTSTSVTTS